jgi:hypothetical protein
MSVVRVAEKVLIGWKRTFTSSKGDQGPFKDYELNILTIAMGLGFVALSVVSFSFKGKQVSWCESMGLSTVISLSSILCGGILGFLFGIPRSLQKVTENRDNGEDGKRPYENNTNLEQISDWLSKIIVGVSLTQLDSIERRFNNLVNFLAKGLFGGKFISFSSAYISSLIIFYSICGFMCVYLWAKIYLLQQLYLVENSLSNILNNVSKEIKLSNEEQKKQLRIAELQKKQKQFNKQKSKVIADESREEFRDIVAKSKPGPIKYYDDCQKARWGRSAFAGDYKITASCKRSETYENERVFTVTIVVEKKDGSSILSPVYFFLHDTYYPHCVVKVDPTGIKAVLVRESYEAFTVGAVCNDGAVKLELNLNEAVDCPTGYKYEGELPTIDEIESELESLTSK